MIPTDEIISMANQCGLPLTYVPHDDDTFSLHVDGLVAFANLVAARAAAIEREVCAARCDSVSNRYKKLDEVGCCIAAEWCAAEIRARGERK